MRARVLIIAVPLVLAACQVKVGKDETDNGASVSVGADGNVSVRSAEGDKGLAISVPGFEAKMNIPGLQMGGENMDIDGMKLYPGTKLDAINVNGHDKEGGVDMRFTSAAAPAALARYYADSARAHDFANVKVTTDGAASTLTADKPDDDKLTITMAPDPKGGTTGHIMVVDAK
jgi:hypothetical protein